MIARMYQLMIVRAFSYCLTIAVGGGESSVRVKGYPAIPLKEFAVCRMVYRESNRKDLESGH
jgi:hypothetical protein